MISMLHFSLKFEKDVMVIQVQSYYNIGGAPCKTVGCGHLWRGGKE